jgi:hypothetical protein
MTTCLKLALCSEPGRRKKDNKERKAFPARGESEKVLVTHAAVHPSIRRRTKSS